MDMITSLDQLDLSKHYTYSDYILWKFQERVELLKGKLLPLAAPNVQHQRISSALHTRIGSHLIGKKCDVFSVPFDVRLPLPNHLIKGNKIDTVVQPDICVVCDQSKLDKQGCVGPPDLVIEILSPGNSKKEMKAKYELYEEAGVLEYLVVNPIHRHALLYHLNKDTQKFVGNVPLTDEDAFVSKSVEGLEIQLVDIFPEENFE